MSPPARPALPRMLSSGTHDRRQGWGGRMASRPQSRRTLTDSQQGHVDEEVPNGGDHILAHLPLHLLRVQLRRETLDPEHYGSFSKASRRCTLLSSSDRLARTRTQPDPTSCPTPRFRPATGTCEGQSASCRRASEARRPAGGGRSLKSRSLGGLFLNLYQL